MPLIFYCISVPTAEQTPQQACLIWMNECLDKYTRAWMHERPYNKTISSITGNFFERDFFLMFCHYQIIISPYKIQGTGAIYKTFLKQMSFPCIYLFSFPPIISGIPPTPKFHRFFLLKMELSENHLMVPLRTPLVKPWRVLVDTWAHCIFSILHYSPYINSPCINNFIYKIYNIYN